VRNREALSFLNIVGFDEQKLLRGQQRAKQTMPANRQAFNVSNVDVEGIPDQALHVYRNTVRHARRSRIAQHSVHLSVNIYEGCQSS